MILANQHQRRCLTFLARSSHQVCCAPRFSGASRRFASTSSASGGGRIRPLIRSYFFGIVTGAAGLFWWQQCDDEGCGCMSVKQKSDKANAKLDFKPFERVLYLMRGVPCSGKSYLANKVLEEHLSSCGVFGPLIANPALRRCFIMSTDDYFSTIDEQTGDEHTAYDMKQIKVNHEKNQARCKASMELGITPIIVDNTNTAAWEMKAYVELAEASGYRVVIKDALAAQPGLTHETIKQRTEERQRQTGKEVPWTVIERMLKRFEALPEDDEAAKKIILASEAPWIKAQKRREAEAKAEEAST